MISAIARLVWAHPLVRVVSDTTIRGRGLVGHSSVAAWIVLVSALPIGIRNYLALYRPTVFPLGWSPASMTGLNFHTYYVAALAARTGGDMYSAVPPGWSEAYTYLYPPITVVSFYPFTVVDWWTGYLVILGLLVIASGIATALLVRYIEGIVGRVGWLDLGLIFVFVLFSTHSMATVYYGNVNLFLALGVIAGFYLYSRGATQWAGVAFGVVALFKVFPALLGVWLVRIRAWRAVGAAFATGVGGILVGVLVFGVETTNRFFTEVLFNRAGSASFIGGYPADGLYYVTVQRPLSHLIWTIDPNAHPAWLFVGSFAVCGLVLAYFYLAVPTRMDRLIAIFVTLTVAIVMFPSYRMYLALLFFPLVPLLYLWDGPGLGVFTTGGVVLSFTYRPGDVIELASTLPDPVFTVISMIAAFATVQLYGLAIMLIGCAIYKRSVGTGGWTHLRSLIAAYSNHRSDRTA